MAFKTDRTNGDIMNTLYISDLDGTLLDSTPKTSEYTNATINEMLNKGMIISFATARSLVTAKRVTEGLEFNYPSVVHNGTFIVNKDGKILHKNIFDKADSHYILSTILENKLNPVVFSLIDEKQKFSYVLENVNEATKDFLNERCGDSRNREVFKNEQLYDGEIYYFTLIGDKEKLEPLYNSFKNKYHCFYQVDMYSGEYWLEILPSEATKANAVKQLKELLNCDKIVAFGDGINDIDMFSIADECYATENAVEKLKEIATAVIDSNDKDGVAKWLKMRYNKNGAKLK